MYVHNCCNIECSKKLTAYDILYNGRFCVSCLRDLPEIKIRAYNLQHTDIFYKGGQIGEISVRKVWQNGIECTRKWQGSSNQHLFTIGLHSQEIILLKNKACKKLTESL